MWRFVILSFSLMSLVGCGAKKDDKVIVKGTIAYKGQPVNGAGLVLYPASGNTVSIPVTQEGTFEVLNVPEGEYIVVVQPATGNAGVPSTKGMDPAKAAEMKSKIEAMKSVPTIPIPKKYTEQKTSDLKMTISKANPTVELVLKD